MTPRACLSLLLSILLLGGCAQYAKVTEAPVRFNPVPPGTGSLVRAEEYIQAALTGHGKIPALECMGYCLAAADVAATRLQRAPRDIVAVRDYNFALSRLFAIIREENLRPWNGSFRVPSPRGEYVLAARAEKPPTWVASDYEFIPADQMDISGMYLKSRTVRLGLGACLVTRRWEPLKTAASEFMLPRAEYGATAVAHFKGRRCEILVEDPLSTETVTLGGHTFPLAADFTAPIAVRLTETNYRKLEFMRLLRPDLKDEGTGIVRLQEFDPEKITVLVIHGLMDSPATWSPMLNALRGDPEIRKRYQFWFFGYPTGIPYPYAAAILRKQLDAALRKFPQKKPMVVIGHSMGGLISRLLITDAGDRLWMAYFHKSPARTPLRGSSRKFFTDSLIFEHQPQVGRAIFIATPHKGSRLAQGWIGRLGARLIKAPAMLLGVAADAARIATLNGGAVRISHIPTSLDSLSPSDQFVEALAKIPVRKEIPFHSIIGDRGKGNTPNSSDGAVPYWSSHMEGAQSELIVPSWHRAHQNAEAIEEVKRILYLNAKVRR